MRSDGICDLLLHNSLEKNRRRSQKRSIKHGGIVALGVAKASLRWLNIENSGYP
jgi:hypothetical protein